MDVETVCRLAEIPNICGLKEASGDLEQLKRLYKALPSAFALYSGDDGLTLPFMKEGAVGVVSVASHCVGLAMHRMIDLAVAGDWESAAHIDAQLAPLLKALFITSNPSPVKAALRYMGYKVGVPRLPLIDVTAAEWTVIEAALVQQITF